ncbi:MAG TPA: 16S rRNA (adenine(1518)-N(6)/adenine(1519)-N(6))-dimethyltransferase RsmA, partial [Methanothrix soehngenii]|nr:16S rRNA (adenine(1518)-N(6)/adenine(1519)-N(6))-dimethyltransferase RsmA [Methanothrix soehngenii]
MRLGQHFLIDRSIVDSIVSHADLGLEDWVLEIGPGEGILTRELAARAGRVYAVEIDPDLAASLCNTAPNVMVIHADALTVRLPQYNKIVSNLPYNISSKITYRLLSRSFDLAVLMFQKEFAQRLKAEPASKIYGRLGMVAGFFSHIEILQNVSRKAFRPVPDVDSAIVRLRPRTERPQVDPRAFMRLADILFRNRRK